MTPDGAGKYQSYLLVDTVNVSEGGGDGKVGGDGGEGGVDLMDVGGLGVERGVVDGRVVNTL